MDNSPRFECFDMRYFLSIRACIHTILDEVIVNLYFLLLYRLPGPTLHSGSITSIPTPFAQRFHQLQNTPAVNSEYTETDLYLPRSMCI